MAQPRETIEVTAVKRNGALDGFNQWALNSEAFSMKTMKPMFIVHEGVATASSFAMAATMFIPYICIVTASNWLASQARQRRG